jgi:hypothetical protein
LGRADRDAALASRLIRRLSRPFPRSSRCLPRQANGQVHAAARADSPNHLAPFCTSDARRLIRFKCRASVSAEGPETRSPTLRNQQSVVGSSPCPPRCARGYARGRSLRRRHQFSPVCVGARAVTPYAGRSRPCSSGQHCAVVDARDAQQACFLLPFAWSWMPATSRRRCPVTRGAQYCTGFGKRKVHHSSRF